MIMQKTALHILESDHIHLYNNSSWNNVTFDTSHSFFQYFISAKFIYHISLTDVNIINFDTSGNNKTSVFELHTLTGGQIYIQGFNARDSNSGIRNSIEN